MFRSRLKYILLDIGMEQIELAEILGKEQTYISRIATTKTIPNVQFLYKMAKALSERGNKRYSIEDLYQGWD